LADRSVGPAPMVTSGVHHPIGRTQLGSVTGGGRAQQRSSNPAHRPQLSGCIRTPGRSCAAMTEAHPHSSTTPANSHRRSPAATTPPGGSLASQMRTCRRLGLSHLWPWTIGNHRTLADCPG
jgi:hypothetical protein